MQAQNQSQQPANLSRASTFGNHAGAQLGHLTQLREYFLRPDQTTNRDTNLQIAIEILNETTPDNRHIIRDCLISSTLSHSASAVAYSLGARPELYILAGVATSCASGEAFALYRFCNEEFTEINQASPVDQDRLSLPNQAPINTNSMSDNLGDLSNNNLSVENQTQTHIQRYINNPDTSRRCLLVSASLIQSLTSLQAQCPNELSRFVFNSSSRAICEGGVNAFCLISSGGFYQQRLFLERGGRGNIFRVLDQRDSTSASEIPTFHLSASVGQSIQIQRIVDVSQAIEPSNQLYNPRSSTEITTRSLSSSTSTNSMNL